MRKNPHSFDFYPDDFISGTVDMTAIQVGMYMRCICYLFARAVLPQEPSKLQRIMGITVEEHTSNWGAVREKFVENEHGELYNVRLQVEKDKAVRTRLARTEAGKKGGLAKATNLLEQKRSGGKKEVGAVLRSIDVDLDTSFDSFWRMVPSHKKRSKPAAKKAFASAIRKIEPTILFEQYAAYAASDEGTTEFASMPSAWLNQERWTDEPDAWKRSSNGSDNGQAMNQGAYDRAMERYKDHD